MQWRLAIVTTIAIPAYIAHAAAAEQAGAGAARSATACRPAVLRIETDPAHAQVPVLSWDTEGGDRARTNLLRAPVELRVQSGGAWRKSHDLPARCRPLPGRGMRYELDLPSDDHFAWEIRPEADRLAMVISGRGPSPFFMPEIELVFPFNPAVACTTVLASQWAMDGSLRAPAVVSAPDFGQMLLSCTPAGLKGRLEGNRRLATVDLVLQWPGFASGGRCTVTLTPLRLPTPPGLEDPSLWAAVRRGWFNTFQPTANHSPGKACDDTIPGVLANNVISDRVISVMYLWSDAALLVPEAAPRVSFAEHVRRTLDWCFEERLRPDGEVINYENRPMLDAGAAPLVAAWDYVEATGNRRWLAYQIEPLQRIAEHLARHDLDGDGLVELPHTGNYGEMTGYNSAYDTYNSGHKDGYTNLLVYRGWRCLADLERQLGRRPQQDRYRRLADRLRAAFAATLYNPATGWLAWWKSADGQLHDYASPVITSMAIEYGLVEPARGRQMLAQLWKKIDQIGFRRFDLGLPVTLVPVRKGDYLRQAGPRREDGSDTFGLYLNGGCLVSDTIHFLVAHYMVGEGAKADRILRAMVERQARGVFPNGGGFQNGYGNGGEFVTWEGKPCGYEGHLTYSWSFLQAALLRQPQFRARLYRALMKDDG
jgi:hypothetical protein